MIISNEQIRSVLDLTKPTSPTSAEQTDRPDTSSAGQERSGGIRIGDREIRNVRLKSLRELLTSDAYEIPEDMLAEKIIGRALCDQVPTFYDVRREI